MKVSEKTDIGPQRTSWGRVGYGVPRWNTPSTVYRRQSVHLGAKGMCILRHFRTGYSQIRRRGQPKAKRSGGGEGGGLLLVQSLCNLNLLEARGSRWRDELKKAGFEDVAPKQQCMQIGKKERLMFFLEDELVHCDVFTGVSLDRAWGGGGGGRA